MARRALRGPSEAERGADAGPAGPPPRPSAVPVTASASGPVTQVVEETPAGLCQLTDSYVESSPRYLALPSWQQAGIRLVLAVLCDRLETLNPRLPARELAVLIAPYKVTVTVLARGGFLTSTQASTLIYLADNLTPAQPAGHHHRLGGSPWLRLLG